MRAIQTITNSKYNSQTEPLSKLLNMVKLPDLYKFELYKLFYKIQNEHIPHYFTTILNPLIHHYNTRREAVQQSKTMHTFAQHNCLFYMIDLINKSPIIKVRVTTSQAIQSFVFSVKRDILNSYEFLCSVPDCYGCTNT